MNTLDTRLLSIEQATGLYLNKSKKSTEYNQVDDNASFQAILDSKAQEENDLKFSKHANRRLESRNITLSDDQLGRLSEGVDQARGKSINESLVMMDNLAFIVNVKSNTVITAMEQGEEANVFTNIDGAVIV